METTRVILGPQGTATPKQITPDFYAELDREFDGFAGHVLLSRHRFEETWDTWEIHPKGDEIVYLLEGDVDFILWIDGEEKIVRVDAPVSYIIVPQGTWHMARPRVRTSMLFITPGEGTLNADSPAPESES